MQFKIFSIPVLGGEASNAEMNVFLRSHKILHVEKRLLEHQGEGSFWSFCIKYLDAPTTHKRKPRVDYKEILDPESYQRYLDLRSIRKQVAAKENIEVYVIFTNEQLAAMARLDKIDKQSLLKVKGIGEKKLEKYGSHFIGAS